MPDTGTAIILAKKGDVFGVCGDEAALSRGIEKTYATDNLRFSQLVLSCLSSVSTNLLLRLIFCIPRE